MVCFIAFFTVEEMGETRVVDILHFEKWIKFENKGEGLAAIASTRDTFLSSPLHFCINNRGNSCPFVQFSILPAVLDSNPYH